MVVGLRRASIRTALRSVRTADAGVHHQNGHCDVKASAGCCSRRAREIARTISAVVWRGDVNARYVFSTAC